MKLWIAILFIVATGCETAVQDKLPAIPGLVIRSADTALQLVNGVWYYQRLPFSGTIEKNFASAALQSRQHFYQGKEEGLLETFYPDGSKDTRRFYHHGEKDSVNEGWWPNGRQKFVYHFRTGSYEGSFEEWYESGKPYKRLIYHEGKEQSGKGWRENGKVYMSFVVRDGRLYGLVNPNLCYSLKNERGE